MTVGYATCRTGRWGSTQDSHLIQRSWKVSPREIGSCSSLSLSIHFQQVTCDISRDSSQREGVGERKEGLFLVPVQRFFRCLHKCRGKSGQHGNLRKVSKGTARLEFTSCGEAWSTASLTRFWEQAGLQEGLIKCYPFFHFKSLPAWEFSVFRVRSYSVGWGLPPHFNSPQIINITRPTSVCIIPSPAQAKVSRIADS